MGLHKRIHCKNKNLMKGQANASAKSKELQPVSQAETVAAHLLLPQSTWQKYSMTFLKAMLFAFLFISTTYPSFAQTNSRHVKVSGYYRKDGTYVQPYFRTAPNSTSRDNFSTKGNTNPYTGKPGWIEPDSKYNTFYYSTYTYPTNKTQNGYKTSTTSTKTILIQSKNRTYIEDEYGAYSCYLTVKDERTFNIYDMKDELILYLVVNHRGDWRIFDSNWIYIKTIFVETEK
jgi:hypothetical protein